MTVRQARARGRGRGALTLLGPAFVAAVAYVDPGNFATNFGAGAKYGYSLLWVIVLASLMAMLVQYVAAKVGLVSGRSLPELCADRFGRRLNFVLWVQAEVVAMATDLAEFVGAALGLWLVFRVPLLPAAFITAVISFLVLALGNRGYRRLELAIVALLAIVGAGFVYLFCVAGAQNWGQLGDGLVPRIAGGDAAQLAVGIVGATLMPHVVYLHSELQKARVRPADDRELRTLLSFNRWDCVIGLGLAGLVNASMLCTAAVVFGHGRADGGSGGLNEIHSGLQVAVGGSAALAFAVALMASGISSASVGTYAGQVVMSGFVGWRISPFLRRTITMLPSLLVLGLAHDLSVVLVYSQIVLSFGIPFALVPLLLFSSDRRAMGKWRSSWLMMTTLAVIVAVVCALNGYLLASIW